MPKRFKLNDGSSAWVIGAAQGEVFDASRRTLPIKIDAAYGDDKLIGGSGDDTLIGGGGADTIEGGEGADVIWINKWSYSRNVEGERDTVVGFRSGVDKLKFTGATNDPITWSMVQQIQMGSDLLVVVNNSTVPENCIGVILKDVTTPLVETDFIF